jgi:hypothetical protein
MSAFNVEVLTRSGNVERTKFFTKTHALDYLALARTNGRNDGGAIVSDLKRVADFGLMRNGKSLRSARKTQRS